MTDKERFNELKKVFLIYYQYKTEEEYYFTAKDAKNLKLLQKKIEFSCSNNNLDVTKNPELVSKTLQVMLKKMPEFYQDKLDIAIINSGYNSIISYIKQNKENKIDNYQQSIKKKYDQSN